MSCQIIHKSDKIEPTVHTSCYWVLGLLCVNWFTEGSNMAGTEPLNEEAVPHTKKPHGAQGGG